MATNKHLLPAGHASMSWHPLCKLKEAEIRFYGAAVLNIIRTVNPSSRGEMESTDVNNAYIERGPTASDTFLGGRTGAGNIPSLTQATKQASGEQPSLPRAVGRT